MWRLAHCSHVVYAGQQASQLVEIAVAQFVRRPAADAREQREADSDFVQRLQGAAVVEGLRSDHGDLLFNQIEEKVVFLQNLLVAPASRSIELDHTIGVAGHLRFLVQFDFYLVDTVFQAVKRHAASGATHSGRLHGVQDTVRRQFEEKTSGSIVVRIAALLSHQRSVTPSPGDGEAPNRPALSVGCEPALAPCYHGRGSVC